jgi:hypothetical protein
MLNSLVSQMPMLVCQFGPPLWVYELFSSLLRPIATVLEWCNTLLLDFNVTVVEIGHNAIGAFT